MVAGRKGIKFILFFASCIVVLLCTGGGDVQAAISKLGVEYPASVSIRTNKEERIWLLSEFCTGEEACRLGFEITKLATSSKNLKVRHSVGDVPNVHRLDIYGKQEGAYTISVSVRMNATGKKEVIKIPAHVEDTEPIKGISIAGVKLKKLKGRETPWGDGYYSKRPSGKISVEMNGGYKVTGIEVWGTDEDRQNPDGDGIPYYNQEGVRDKVENGGKVYLNSKADGDTQWYQQGEDTEKCEDYFTPLYSYSEAFGFRTAHTMVVVKYKEKGSDVEMSAYLNVYTKTK